MAGLNQPSWRRRAQQLGWHQPRPPPPQLQRRRARAVGGRGGRRDAQCVYPRDPRAAATRWSASCRSLLPGARRKVGPALANLRRQAARRASSTVHVPRATRSSTAVGTSTVLPVQYSCRFHANSELELRTLDHKTGFVFLGMQSALS
jgi:hypothetical protein